jgi:hemerythrin-like domain-containing protein
MHRVLEDLRNEHRTILAAIGKAEAMADAAERGAAVPASALNVLREFFMVYVHGVHQRKEDSVLFPWLRLRGVHEGAGCVGALAVEHKEVAAAFPEAAEDMAWVTPVRIYCSLLRNHIRREDEVVFPIAERSATAQEAGQLLPDFAAIDGSARRAGIDEIVRAVTSLPYGM